MARQISRCMYAKQFSARGGNPFQKHIVNSNPSRQWYNLSVTDRTCPMRVDTKLDQKIPTLTSSNKLFKNVANVFLETCVLNTWSACLYQHFYHKHINGWIDWFGGVTFVSFEAGSPISESRLHMCLLSRPTPVLAFLSYYWYISGSLKWYTTSSVEPALI